MRIINSPWQDELLSFIRSAKKELRVAAPYYGEDVISTILKRSKANTKHFVLSLSEHDVRSGVQSPAALRAILKDPSCTVKFASNLHAKVLIADQRFAIVTSSNLTLAGLSKNAEVGVFVDDPKIVRSLARTFDRWFTQAGGIDASVPAKLERIQRPSMAHAFGKSYGKRIPVGGVGSQRSSMSQKPLGWILVHSKNYGEDGDEYDSPQEQLDKEYEPGLKWHWKRGSPLGEGDGFNVLLAWKGEVFGEAAASVTRAVKYKDYNFAFILSDYKKAKNSVRLNDLGLRNYQNLVRLDERVLKAYRKLAG